MTDRLDVLRSLTPKEVETVRFIAQLLPETFSHARATLTVATDLFLYYQRGWTSAKIAALDGVTIWGVLGTLKTARRRLHEGGAEYLLAERLGQKHPLVLDVRRPERMASHQRPNRRSA